MRERDNSALLTSKYGFSVVAPIKIIVPFSTCGKSASCCALLKRWISSTSKIVRCPYKLNRSCASSTIRRISATPASTALKVSKWEDVLFAIMLASDVLPVPGGPHKIIEENRRSASTARRSNFPGPRISSCPVNSSSVRGRIRAASGCPRSRSSARAASNKSRAACFRPVSFLLPMFGIYLNSRRLEHDEFDSNIPPHSKEFIRFLKLYERKSAQEHSCALDALGDLNLESVRVHA